MNDPKAVLLSVGQRKHLIEAARRHSSLTGLFLATLYETGIRRDELVRLCADDLDCDARQMRVKDRKDQGSYRVVHLSQQLADELCEYLNVRESGTLFRSSRNRPISSGRIKNLLQEVTKAAGLSIPVTTHMIRQSRAADLLAAGMSPGRVKTLLGEVEGITNGYDPKPLTLEVYDRVHALTV